MTWHSTLRHAWFISFSRRTWLFPLVCCMLACGSSRDSFRRVKMADESFFRNRSIFNNYTFADTLFSLIPCSTFDTAGGCLNVSPIRNVSPIQIFTPQQKAKKQTSGHFIDGSRRLVPVAVRHGRLTFHGADTLRGGAAGRAIQMSSAVPKTQHSYFIWFIVALAGGCLVGLFVCVLIFLKFGR